MTDNDPFPVPTVLSRSYAKEHSAKNFGFIDVLRESFSNKDDIWIETIRAANGERKFQSTLAAALGSDAATQVKNARTLRMYIKTRAPGLKFWSTMSSGFISLFGFTGAVIALLFSSYSVSSPILAGSLLFVSAGLTVFKYFVDKRMFWYDYVSEHLSAIIGVAA